MCECCGKKKVEAKKTDPCSTAKILGCSSQGASVPAEEECPLTWFGNMIGHCHEYAVKAHVEGKPIVGIMCEYTPRELIMAAGAVPVCLCGGSLDTISVAEQELPSNLCPLIKSTYGYHLQRSNPFLEMSSLIVAETTCDGKKKMYELMAQTRPMYILELPQKETDGDARAHWYREVEKLKSHLESVFKVRITDCALNEAIEKMNRERSLRRQLAALMQRDLPPLTGRQLIQFKSSISCIDTDCAQYERALEMLSAKPPDRSMGSRVRVLMTGVPMAHGAEKVLDIIEEHGGLVVSMENCTGLKPIMDDVPCGNGDPLRAIADHYFKLPCSVKTPNNSRLNLIRRLVKEYRPECIIDLVWQACLTYDVESHFVSQTAEEMGLPYLRVETDYSPSDTARIAVRVEALFETAGGTPSRYQ